MLRVERYGRLVVLILLVVISVIVPGTISAEERPLAIGLNAITNKVYVVYTGSNVVTVLDGATLSTTEVNVGGTPIALAVNPVTNKIYVANSVTNDVTVIDGSTLSTTTVSVGGWPQGVAVNPETNKIYVVNNASGSVTVIDGVTHATTTVKVGSSPQAVAVNPVTNKIYVANVGSNNLTVIDGATNTTRTVNTGPYPYVVGVNTVTDKIYVGDGYGNVTVIDGATDGVVTTVQTAGDCVAMAINPDSNKIYVGSQTANKVTVIDGVTNSTITVNVGLYPLSVAVNSVTNTTYVANFNGGNVTVIDGATNAATRVNGGEIPHLLAVNPVTNKIYVANWDHAVTVIDGASTGTARPADITSPEPATTLAGSSATFQWNTGFGITYYQLWIGTKEGSHDILSTTIPVGTNSYTANNLPATGQALYVRLNSVVNGTYLYNNYTYIIPSITPEAVTITWRPTLDLLVYGTPLSSGHLNATAFDHHNNTLVEGTFAYDPPLGTVLPVGTRNLIASFTPADATTYASQKAIVTITVTPATLTVTADDVSRVYGSDNPSFTYQYSGFVNQEGASAVNTAPICSSVATVLSAAGAYDIVCSGTVAANYSVNHENGTLTVRKAAVAIALRAAQPVILIGQPSPVTVFVSSDAGIPSGTVSFTENQSFIAIANVVNGSATLNPLGLHIGPHTITATYSGDENHLSAISNSISVSVDLPLQLSRHSRQVRPTDTRVQALSRSVSALDLSLHRFGRAMSRPTSASTERSVTPFAMSMMTIGQFCTGGEAESDTCACKEITFENHDLCKSRAATRK